MHPDIKLSICIATRNRGAFIGETIRSIAEQSPSGVEIVVLDGASSDHTPQIVRALQQSIPLLRYVRQESNGGVDRDYDLCVGEARGEYVWLMSDDDVLKPGAMSQVLKALQKRYSLVVINSELRDLALDELLDERRLRFDADRSYAPGEMDRMFDEVSGYLSYIGAVIIRRDLWQDRDRRSFYGSYFIHVGVIFQSSLPGQTLVVADPLISVRFGNTQWRPKEFEIRMVRWTELIGALDGISDGVRWRKYRPDPWRSLKSLTFYRAKGTYDLENYQRWVRPRLVSLPDRLLAFGVAVLPGPLANLAGLVFCRIPYRDSNIHLLDMRASRYYFRNWFRTP
jgi:glycosyltransferase involved in cell wall biosynthesis